MIEEIKRKLIGELTVFGFSINSLDQVEVLSDKDGVIVVRVEKKGESFIVKYFDKPEYRREISNYKLLNKLGVKTIKLLNSTEYSLLLEDVNTSDTYRLATKDDMESKDILKSLAMWYKEFHSRGKHYLENNEVTLYSEIEEVTKESIELIKEKSGYTNSVFWSELLLLIPKMKKYCKNNRTLNYNDFNYTNMIVSFDKKEAFMFDYNFLGEGISFFDLRNIISNRFISKENQEYFLKEYGIYNKKDVLIDNVISHIVNLQFGYQKEVFPSWAENSEDLLKNNTIYNSIKELKKVW